MKSRFIQHRAIRTTIVGIVLLALSGCSFRPAAVSPQKTDDALPLATRLQKAQVGGITLTTTWQNPSRSATTPIQFKIQMDIHSGSLDQYDLASVSTLANDSGLEVKASRWDPPAGGHHGSGTLYFPPTDSSGKPLINGDTKYVEWTIRGLADAAEKTIRWEITQ